MVGKHQLHISAEDYYPHYSDFYLETEALRYRPQLEEIPRCYKTWWFWTITGVVVAGAGTAIVLATVPPKGAVGGLDARRE
jgi:hypothetical protein